MHLCLYGNLTLLSMCIFNPYVFLQLCRFLNRAKQVRELLNKHFEQEEEKIITSLILKDHTDRPGMYCIIKLD